MTLQQLIDRASQALSTVPPPSDGRTRPLPDVRTVRYYQSNGLIDAPSRYDGRSAVYAQRHLLQVVAIKTLQAEGYTLAQIQGHLQHKSDPELREALKTVGVRMPTHSSDTAAQSTAAQSTAAQSNGPPATQTTAADLESAGTGHPPTELSGPAAETAKCVSTPREWHTHELADGVLVTIAQTTVNADALLGALRTAARSHFSTSTPEIDS